MTYGKCPALSQFVEESAGLELTARKGLSVPSAVIGPSGRNHCFRGESSLSAGIKSVLSLRQIRVSTVCSSSHQHWIYNSVFPVIHSIRFHLMLTHLISQ